MRSPLWLCLLVGLASNNYLDGLSGQEVLGEPRLRISGPEGQFVVVTARYFNAGQVVRTVTSRLQINPQTEPMLLDFGYSGVLLTITVPTKRPVTLELLDGDHVVAAKTTEAIGAVDLKHGLAEVDPAWERQRVLLNDDEQAFARSFLDGLSSGHLRNLVSDLPMANIDWPMLEAYCQAVSSTLGPISQNAMDLDGWLSWQGSLGARVLAGTVHFANGTCDFTLMVIEHRLVDVLVNSKEMPDAWFPGPSSETIYIARSDQLANFLFRGAAAQARDLFSRRYYEDVTLESLQELSGKLRQRYGTEVVASEYKKSELEDYDPVTRSRTLKIYHAVALETGKRCINETNIVFPCGPNIISRGHLASINIREAWQSAAPELAESALTLLNAMSGTFEANAVFDLFHPDMLAQLDRRSFAERLQGVSNSFGSLNAAPDWDQWQAEQSRGFVTAKGPLEFENEIAIAQLNFADGKLLGVTLLGEDHAVSTLDLVTGPKAISRIGQAFWENLLAGETESAHKLLAPEFQTQFPLERFLEFVDASDIGDLQGFKEIRAEGVRFADRLDRSLPVMLTAYYIVELDGGQHQPLRCEFRGLEASTGWEYELLNFNTEFAAAFPVTDYRQAKRLVQAIQSADGSQLLSLLAEVDRPAAELVIMNGFLGKLRSTFGPLHQPARFKNLHQYSPGERVEMVTCTLSAETLDIPLSAVFQYDALKSFSLHAPPMTYFLDAIEDDGVFRRSIEQFVELWSGKQIGAAMQKMVDDLQTEEVGERLRRILDKLEREHGPYQGMSIVRLTRSQTFNSVRGELQLRFERGLAAIILDLQVDAFAARIASIELE